MVMSPIGTDIRHWPGGHDIPDGGRAHRHMPAGARGQNVWRESDVRDRGPTPGRGGLRPAQTTRRDSGGGRMIRVLIAEDMHMIRGALVALLSLEADMQVVAELERGDEILETSLRTEPDVAVVDIDLPGLDGLSAAAPLHDRLPACRTLVLTGLSQPGNLLRALKVHVRGFIVKDAPAEKLADGIRRVARGERGVAPELGAA